MIFGKNYSYVNALSSLSQNYSEVSVGVTATQTKNVEVPLQGFAHKISTNKKTWLLQFTVISHYLSRIIFKGR